jgi:hypothetical protein
MLRSTTRTLLLAMLLGTVGTLFGVVSPAAASPRIPATSAPPPAPSSTVSPAGPDHVKYCVQNYAPNSDVAVQNQANGATGTIHTDASGSGCTTIAVKTDCKQSVSNTIVASGTGQDGKPATSQATYNAPPDPNAPGCHPTPSPTPSSTHGGGNGGGNGNGGNGNGNGGNPPGCPPPGQARLSATVVPQGTQISGTACGFTPGETVDAFVHSNPVYVGSTTASSDGSVSGSFKLPPSIGPGHHTFMFVGESSGTQADAPFTVTNATVGSGGGTIPGAGGSGGLAFTGADIAAMVAAAVLLLVVGTGLLVTVRRRRAVPAA